MAALDILIRHSTPEDLERMLQIYDHARRFMRETGNPNQWILYPERELLEADIRCGNSYVVCTGDEICGTFVYRIGEDESYKVIEQGQWLNDETYGTIHRIASDGTQRGILKAVVEFAKQSCPNIRIDTHEQNCVMRSALEKLGFVYCGIIYCMDDLSPHSPRLAFQFKA